MLVLDNGFVYVGHAERSLSGEEGYWVMTQPRAIRQWETGDKGPGHMALRGKGSATLDDCAPLRWHERREVHRFDTRAELW